MGGVVTEGVINGGIINGGVIEGGVITEGAIIESTPVVAPATGDAEQAAPPAPVEAPAVDGPSPVTETSGKAEMMEKKADMMMEKK